MTSGYPLRFGARVFSTEQIGFDLYTATCCLYFGHWSFLLPYLVGACAPVDACGRTLAPGNAAIGAGLACGPFIAASLIGENGFGILAMVATAFVATGFYLIIPLLRVSQQFDDPELPNAEMSRS